MARVFQEFVQRPGFCMRIILLALALPALLLPFSLPSATAQGADAKIIQKDKKMKSSPKNPR